MSKIVYFRAKVTGNVFSTQNPEFWPDCERLTAKDGEAAMRAQSLAKLHGILKPGDTVYTVLRHVSSTGMSRRIDLYVFRDNAPVYLSGYVEDVLSYERHANKQGLVVPGGGMDMGFHLVHSLSRAMWPDGTPEPHGRRNREADSDGGYALKHDWL